MSKPYKKIKLCRIGKNLSQQNLADMLGVSCQMITAYEDGSQEPDANTLEALSNALGISVDELLLSQKTSRTKRNFIVKVSFLFVLIAGNLLILLRNCLIFMANNKYIVLPGEIIGVEETATLAMRLNLLKIVNGSEILFMNIYIFYIF